MGKKIEEKENGSFYLSIPQEWTLCPRQVYYSTLRSSLKRPEETMNLADNLYHIKSNQLFDIPANLGAKFFMHNSVTLKKKQRSTIDPFSKSPQFRIQCKKSKYSIEFCVAFK